MSAIEIYNILCKELSFDKMIKLHKLILHKITYLEDEPVLTSYCCKANDKGNRTNENE